MNKPTIIVLAVSAALVALGGIFIFNPVEPNFNKSWFDQEEEIVGDGDDEVVNLTLVTFQNFQYNVRFRYPEEWTVIETPTTASFYIEPPESEDIPGDFHISFLTQPGRDLEAEFSGEEFFVKKERSQDTLYSFRQKDEKTGFWVSFYFFQKDDRIVSIQHATNHPYITFFNVMVNSVEFDFWSGDEIRVVHPEEKEMGETNDAADGGGPEGGTEGETED